MIATNTPLERFELKVDVQPGQCWLWQGHVLPNGYGTFGIDGRTQYAHRFAYETFIGEIPIGLDLDHLCRVRACVNPNHLEAVSRRVNLLRGETIPARNAAKSHCKRGHLFSPENTNWYKGQRRCRACYPIDNRIAYVKRTANG